MRDIWTDAKLPERRILFNKIAGAAGFLLIASLLPKPVQAREEGTPLSIVGPENPFIHENGDPRYPSLITEPLQVPYGSPLRFKLVMACESVSSDSTGSGGFVVSSGPFGEYGPRFTNWLAVTKFRGVHWIVEDLGERGVNGRQLTREGQPLPTLYLTLNPEDENVELESPEIVGKINHPLIRPKLGDSTPEGLIYLGALSAPGVRTTISTLDLLLKQ